MIDFQPALVVKISEREDCLAIAFEEQAMLAGMEEEALPSLPLMLCELQLKGGNANTQIPKLPIKADNIRVDYKAGSRRCFLPIGFCEEGPVRVYAEIDTNLVLLAEGTSVSLEILSQSGTVPIAHEPKSNG